MISRQINEGHLTFCIAVNKKSDPDESLPSLEEVGLCIVLNAETCLKDGLFVCQSCGTKYSVEEAKKIMLEGSVDVSGSYVKIDSSDSVKNYFEIASDAFESKNYGEVERYCNKILEIDTHNPDAWFLKGKAACWNSSVNMIRLGEVQHCFNNAIKYSDEQSKETYRTKSVDETKKGTIAFCDTICTQFLQSISQPLCDVFYKLVNEVNQNGAPFLTNNGADCKALTDYVANVIGNAGTSAWDRVLAESGKYPDDAQWRTFLEKGAILINVINAACCVSPVNPQSNILRYQSMITIQTALLYSYSYRVQPNGTHVKNQWLQNDEKDRMIDLIMQWHGKIKELDPSYNIPSKPSRSSGCYVATCVYGSYDCPQVWTLRRYRDYELAETWYGRAFIRTYYAISPTIVKWFGNTELFKKMWRGKLNRMVKKLQEKGYESTPYEDRNW